MSFIFDEAVSRLGTTVLDRLMQPLISAVLKNKQVSGCIRVINYGFDCWTSFKRTVTVIGNFVYL